MYFFQGQLHLSSTLEIEIDHPALLYGASVFTTLRVYGHLDAKLTHWQAHYHRLTSSIQALGWVEPDWQRVRAGAIALTQHYPVIRITLFPQGEELITGRALPPDLAQRQEQGITAWIAEHPAGQLSRSLAAHKTGNYLAPWLALQKMRSHHAQEVILMNERGEWLETGTGNLWGWRQNCWYTPPLSAGILPGVVRQALLSDFRTRNIEVCELPWIPDLIPRFELLLYTNSVVEYIPIAQVCNGSETLTYNAQHPAREEISCFFINTDAE